MLCALSPHLRPYLSQNYLGMAAISKVGLESHSSLCVSLAEPGRQAVGLLRLILRRSGPPPPPALSRYPKVSLRVHNQTVPGVPLAEARFFTDCI